MMIILSRLQGASVGSVAQYVLGLIGFINSDPAFYTIGKIVYQPSCLYLGSDYRILHQVRSSSDQRKSRYDMC
jgi:hypothetical protein